MTSRAVVCVATTQYYQRGLDRLSAAIGSMGGANMHGIRVPPSNWPTHEAKPYAFKPFALDLAADAGYDTLLWADACMLPVQDMTPLWERIERDGYWFSKNGWSNYEWTANSAYPALFPGVFETVGNAVGGEVITVHDAMTAARLINRRIPHVVATCFGISLKHKIGREFLRQYLTLAKATNAFCGPWINGPQGAGLSVRQAPCGPADVRGHRHDQTAASVIAYNLEMQLTDPPNIFAYGKQGEQFDPKTIMIADGSY